ncbi:MAG: DUF3748 domain-containing protein [Candidatus Hydrogenedentes bacterium]|nr:DUF3748 domain-containing protein [Candidatus Hydrogenedentota bacterium]
MRVPIAITVLSFALIGLASNGLAAEKQLTFTPKNHDLDNNDNFSPDGRFLCYDTRQMVGPGIDNGQSIEMVEIATGKETLLYTPAVSVTGERPAPGVGAVSFSGAENRVAFIHGPPVVQLAERGPYGKPNRQGATVPTDGSGKPAPQGGVEMSWLDYRDIATDRDTIPGAQRGGTHRHEYTLDGKRIGFTYNDFLMPEYDRTVGYMAPHPKAPKGASHYFANLVPIVPKGTAKPGEIEHAAKDSWIGRHGLMRAFIGKVRNADGETYEDSLYMIEIPADVDISTADSGSATRYPSPPKGTSIRRMTHSWVGGTVRGSFDGRQVAYFAKAPDGTTQIFLIASDGSDKSSDIAKQPKQATFLPKGSQEGLRWHPSGNTVFSISNGGIVATCVKPGPMFGRSVFLTGQDDGPPRIKLTSSQDGTLLAFNKTVPTKDKNGKIVKAWENEDILQIFTVVFPDANGDGVIDGLDPR